MPEPALTDARAGICLDLRAEAREARGAARFRAARIFVVPLLRGFPFALPEVRMLVFFGFFIRIYAPELPWLAE